MTRAQGLARTLAAARELGEIHGQAGTVRLTTEFRPATIATRSAERAGVGHISQWTATMWARPVAEAYDTAYAEASS